MGWSSSLGVRREGGVTGPHPKRPAFHEILPRASDSFERAKQRKKDMRFGIWNVSSFCQSGLFKTVAR
jgi:hypothetical protein